MSTLVTSDACPRPTTGGDGEPRYQLGLARHGHPLRLPRRGEPVVFSSGTGPVCGTKDGRLLLQPEKRLERTLQRLFEEVTSVKVGGATPLLIIIRRYLMSLTSLECQVSTLVSSDACPLSHDTALRPPFAARSRAARCTKDRAAAPPAPPPARKQAGAWSVLFTNDQHDCDPAWGSVRPGEEEAVRGPVQRRGARRARWHRRFAPPPIHFTPDSRTYSAPLSLKRQCDRALGARGVQRVHALGLRRVPPLPRPGARHYNRAIIYGELA